MVINPSKYLTLITKSNTGLQNLSFPMFSGWENFTVSNIYVDHDVLLIRLNVKGNGGKGIWKPTIK
jgi:hypothetical protein